MALDGNGEFDRVYIFLCIWHLGSGVMVLVLPIFMDGVLPIRCIMLSFE